MSDTTINFEEDMEIDETALDIEWSVRQGRLAAKYNEHFATCCNALDIANEKVKTIRSELILKVRRDPEKYLKMPKATDPLAEAYYRTHPKYIKAKEKMLQLEYEKNMAEMGKNEINFTRKAALENLVILLGQQYFAGPRMPRDINKEATKAREDSLSKKSGQSMKRKKKKKE